jgi:hypothetical protein
VLVAGGLPLNRKERYYTGTVLPMLVATDDFAHLGRLTELAGLGPVQVDARPASATVQLFTEYGYLESTWRSPQIPRHRPPGTPLMWWCSSPARGGSC